MAERLKLIDTVYNGILSFFNEDENGIFLSYVNQYYDSDTETYSADYPTPWLTIELARYIDKNYYLNHSGDKLISKMYQSLIDESETEPYNVGLKAELMNIIVSKFGDKWNRIYDVFVQEIYKPLENYDMTQKETPNITHTKNVKSDLKTDNDLYGFNSSSAVPVSKSTVSGAKLDNEETNAETGTRDLTRHGNIGVTTTQQMMQSEIDLRNNFTFMNQIMDDTDSILCLLTY